MWNEKNWNLMEKLAMKNAIKSIFFLNEMEGKKK